MSKKLEELKKIEDKIFETNIKKSNEKALTYKITFRYVLVEVLEDFEKRLKEIEDKQNRKISGPIITKVNGTDLN